MRCLHAARTERAVPRRVEVEVQCIVCLVLAATFPSSGCRSCRIHTLKLQGIACLFLVDLTPLTPNRVLVNTVSFAAFSPNHPVGDSECWSNSYQESVSSHESGVSTNPNCPQSVHTRSCHMPLLCFSFSQAHIQVQPSQSGHTKGTRQPWPWRQVALLWAGGKSLKYSVFSLLC